MATASSHIELEQEVVSLLCAQQECGADGGDAATPSSALVALNQWAQESGDGLELFVGGARLASAVLDTRYFTTALLNGEDSLGVDWYQRAPANTSHHDVAIDAEASSLAFALDADHPVIIQNARAETRFRDAFLIEHGVQSGIICPVGYANRKQGTIAVFTDFERVFDREDVMFLQTIAQLLGPRLAYEKAEQKLAEHARLISATIDSLDSMVMLIGDDGRIQRINRACQEVTGFTINDLKTRQLCGAFLPQEEAEVVRNAIAELRKGTSPVRCETDLLTKQGKRRRISWSFAFLPEATKNSTIVLTGIDITKYVDALAKLKKAEKEGDRDEPADEAETAKEQAAEKASDETEAAASDSDEEKNRERRAHKRRSYPCHQAIAPLRDGQLPTATDFAEVRCHDISAGGFSFYLREDPDFDELVVAFGSYPAPLYMKARVVHVTQVDTGRHIERLIGCQYTGRVGLSTAS